MLIYGSRMMGKSNEVTSHGLCGHCGHYGRLKSYDGRKWGHIYFIPLIPAGGHVRVLRECSKCNMGAHVPREAIGQTYREIEKTLPYCVDAAGQGSPTFTSPSDPEPINNASFLHNAVDILVTTGHGNDVPGIIEMLDEAGATVEARVAESAWAESRGDLTRAVQAMRDAHAGAPEQVFPLFMLAEFERRSGNAQAQLDNLEKAAAISDDDPQVLLEMAGPLEQLKRFDDLVAVLDKCIAKVPELAQDKKFMKLHKKYAKKAAR